MKKIPEFRLFGIKRSLIIRDNKQIIEFRVIANIRNSIAPE